jgi:hypothetical protein
VSKKLTFEFAYTDKVFRTTKVKRQKRQASAFIHYNMLKVLMQVLLSSKTFDATGKYEYNKNVLYCVGLLFKTLWL